MGNAQEIALRYMSPRYTRLDKFEQYWDGTQYDGRAPFLTQDENAPPLLERAPCIVHGVGKVAIRDMVNFMMGERRYPHINASTSEDDQDLDDEGTLSEDEASLLERWINGPLSESAVLRHHFPEGLKMAMKACSVALIACFRLGEPRIEALPAKWCTPAFDPATRKLVGLEVFYPYIVEEKNEQTRKWEEVCYLYRRIITTEWDVVFYPAKGKEDGLPPNWVADPAQTVQHNLGFCPAHWYAFERGEPTAAHFDGKGYYQHLLDELDALNLSKSQRHRAAIYSGDPQIWETGVEEGTMPAPMGRSAKIEVEAQAAGPNGKPVGVYTANPMRYRSSASLRRKGPGVVWRYPEATSKVGMLELAGDALDTIADNSDDIKKTLLEDLSVVMVDASEAKTFGALSGKALAFIFSRQIARADSIRLDVQTNLLLPCIDLLLRMCATVGRHTDQEICILGFKKILPILKKFTQDQDVADLTTDGHLVSRRMTKWRGPRLRLNWGSYFETSAEEQNFIVALCVSAYTSNLMPLDNVLEKLREVFPFASVEEIVEKLEAAKVKNAEEQLDMQDKQAGIAAKHEQKIPKGPKGSDSGAKGDKKA